MDHPNAPPAPTDTAALDRRTPWLWLSLCLIAVGVINVVWHLKTPGDWWFEDDAALYAKVGRVGTPWAFFADKTVNRDTTWLNPHAPPQGVNELAPVLYASMWLDMWAAPRSPAWAYAHNAAFYVMTGVCLFLAVGRLVKDRWIAFGTALIWMLLPSTTALVEFLSTRHYMIGMFFALLTLLAFDDGLGATGWPRRWAIARVLAFGWISVVSKEFYPTALLTLAFLWGVGRRDWVLAACPVLLGASYAAYRFAMIEPGVAYYTLPLPTVRQYAMMLLVLPYMTFAGYAGYAMVLATAVLLARRAVTSRAARWVLVVGGATLVVSAATIYPVAVPIRYTWHTLGTWYRTPCVLNTLLLAGFAYALSGVGRPRVQAGILAALALVAGEAAHRTALSWDAMKSAASAEAAFLLSNPGKIILSRQPAWYLPGVQDLYPERKTATILFGPDPTDRDFHKRLVRSDEPIWTFENGRIEPMTAEARKRLLAE